MFIPFRFSDAAFIIFALFFPVITDIDNVASPIKKFYFESSLSDV